MTAKSCRDCKVICPAAICPRPRLLESTTPIVAAYLDCATQWRHGASGGRTGLDYAACRAVWAALRPRATTARLARLFRGVQVIERALLEIQQEWIDERMRAAPGQPLE